jgi:serine protease AprX
VGLATALVCALGATGAAASQGGGHAKLDKTLKERASQPGKSRAIIIFKPGQDSENDVKKAGGKPGHHLKLVDGLAVELPNSALAKLADLPSVVRIVHDRPTGGEMNRVAVTVGARAVQQTYGYTGAGIGVAVIDSGIASWHDDLTYMAGSSSNVKWSNGQRVVAFADFTGSITPYDQYGHGTHVAGIIAGNGYDSLGVRAGIAKDAHLVSLKVLDANGRGVISDVIAALGYAVNNKALYNIRVINLSVGAKITESYKTDPLALAAKRAVDAGIVVVAAAGNVGVNALGQPQYGGITAPGNAPWVLTVGASSHEGTVNRADDVMAPYSSRGPSAIDFQAKPDVVAPGSGVVSLSSPGTALYNLKPAYLVTGTYGIKPYLSLTGTSMSAPVVSGSVALMLQANPKLTPNLVKALLQYTAQEYPGYNALTQGAGFLNTKGAVDLARFFKLAYAGQRYPTDPYWSKKIIWGNHRVGHGVIKPNAPAWKPGVVWGAPTDLTGQNIVWGTYCDNDCDNIVWGTRDSEDNIVWGTASADLFNIVWGTYASDEGDNIVWGTSRDDQDNIVWGTDCNGGNCTGVVWGSARSDEDNIVWGTSRNEDNIVWGTCRNEDNIVWGTSRDEDNIVWGTSRNEDNIVWGTSAAVDEPLFDDPAAPPESFDTVPWDGLLGSSDPLAAGVTLEPVLNSTATVVAGMGGL